MGLAAANKGVFLVLILFLYFVSAEQKSGIEIVPVFISVDPERDTVEQVGEYVKGASFDERIIWIKLNLMN